MRKASGPGGGAAPGDGKGGHGRGRPGSRLHTALAGPGRGDLSSQGLGGHGCGHASKQVHLAGEWWGSLAFPPTPPAVIVTLTVQEAHSPAADAGVGAVAHAALGVAVVLKEAAEKERCVRVTESLEPTSSPPPTSPEHGSMRLVAGAQGQPQATEAQNCQCGGSKARGGCPLQHRGTAQPPRPIGLL